MRLISAFCVLACAASGAITEEPDDAAVREIQFFRSALADADVSRVSALLSSGLDANFRFDGAHCSPSNVVAFFPLFEAKNSGHSLESVEDRVVQVLELLFDNGAKLLPCDYNILHGPAIYGSIRVARFLLERGASLAGSDVEGWTPALLAVAYDQRDMVALLRSYGAELPPEQEVAQRVFVHAASRGDLEKMAKMYRKGAKVDGYAEGRRTALVESLRLVADMRSVTWLLRRGADPNVPATGIAEFTTPLNHVFRKPWSSETADLAALLMQFGASVSGPGGTGAQTPLHIAAGSGETQAVRFLLEHGADVSARDADGRTPLSYAESTEITRLLRKAGATRAGAGPATPFNSSLPATILDRTLLRSLSWYDDRTLSDAVADWGAYHGKQGFTEKTVARKQDVRYLGAPFSAEYRVFKQSGRAEIVLIGSEFDEGFCPRLVEASREPFGTPATVVDISGERAINISAQWLIGTTSIEASCFGFRIGDAFIPGIAALQYKHKDSSERLVEPVHIRCQGNTRYLGMLQGRPSESAEPLSLIIDPNRRNLYLTDGMSFGKALSFSDKRIVVERQQDEFTQSIELDRITGTYVRTVSNSSGRIAQESGVCEKTTGRAKF